MQVFCLTTCSMPKDQTSQTQPTQLQYSFHHLSEKGAWSPSRRAVWELPHHPDRGQGQLLRFQDPIHMCSYSFQWFKGDTDKVRSVTSLAEAAPLRLWCRVTMCRDQWHPCCLNTQNSVRTHFLVKTYRVILYGRAEMNEWSCMHSRCEYDYCYIMWQVMCIYII